MAKPARPINEGCDRWGGNSLSTPDERQELQMRRILTVFRESRRGFRLEGYEV